MRLIIALFLMLYVGNLTAPAMAQRRHRPRPPRPRRPIVVVKPRSAPVPQPARRSLREIGLSGGYVSGIPGATVAMSFHNPFDLVRTTTRLGATYAQGADTAGTTRKHALVFVDEIYRLNPIDAPGVRSYIGSGLNYDAYTTGQTSGQLGYQAYLGFEGGQAGQGSTFFEVGYGTIRTGFSPDYAGVTAQAGYRF